MPSIKSTALSDALDGASGEAEVSALARVLAALNEETLIHIDAGMAIVLPEGRTVESLKPLLDEWSEHPPEGVKANPTLTEAADFIALAKRHTSPACVLFGTPGDATHAPEIRAIFDYHPVGAIGRTGLTAGWCQHRATLRTRYSPEFLVWTKVDGKELTGAEFAEFLESYAQDVVSAPGSDPTLGRLIETLGGRVATASELISLSRNLAVNVEVNVREARTLPSGEVQMTYEEAHKDGQGQPISVPSLFAVALPIFLGGERYQVPVRLRYRIRGGKVTWAMHLHRRDLTLRDAENTLFASVAEAIGAPLFRGEA